MGFFYVYVYCDESGVPAYVGKGTRSRAWAHGRRFGTKPEIVFRTNDEAKALEYEERLILQYGRRDRGTGSLLNRNAGGNGLQHAVVNRIDLATPEFLESCLQQFKPQKRYPKKKRRIDWGDLVQQWLVTPPEPVKHKRRRRHRPRNKARARARKSLASVAVQSDGSLSD